MRRGTVDDTRWRMAWHDCASASFPRTIAAKLSSRSSSAQFASSSSRGTSSSCGARATRHARDTHATHARDKHARHEEASSTSQQAEAKQAAAQEAEAASTRRHRLFSMTTSEQRKGWNADGDYLGV